MSQRPALVPGTLEPRWPAMPPGRLASRVQVDSPEGCQLALLGLPDDLGVRLNHGRPGACEGPSAFRAALASGGLGFDAIGMRSLDLRVFDAGDVPPAPGNDASALAETHGRVEATAAALHDAGLITVGIGGGHDLSLPLISACAKRANRSLGGINLDAHLDVRQRPGSGMPFRRLIEAGYLEPRRFVELGLGRYVNEPSDLRWAHTQSITLVYAEGILDEGLRLEPYLAAAFDDGPGFVSIDLDGIDQAHAPGVSAMNPMGLGVRHAAALARAAGRTVGVRHFDLMELSPPHDHAGRTAKVAALLFSSFVSGLMERPA